MLDLKNLNLEDDLEKAAFDDPCDTVYDMLIHETPKYASDMAKDGRFKTIRWHQDHRQRQREKLFCYLEEITDGEVKRQLKKRGVHQMNTMRSYFFNRFGHGSPDVLMERQRTFLLGMPNSSGEVFPLRVNMEEKLNSLEEEREFLLDMCPVDKRQDYGETRYIAVGMLGIRLHVLCFAETPEGIRVISFRKANAREVNRYAKAKAVD